MPSDLKGKTVIVTGGSGGIGRATALAFAKKGAAVVISYNTDTKTADAVVKEIQLQFGVKAKAVKFDIRDTDQHHNFVQQSLALTGRLDILVNSVGIVSRKSFFETSEADLANIFAVNFFGPFLLMQAVARCMKEQGKGEYSIINVTSLSSKLNSRLPVYEASKASLDRLTQSAAFELVPFGIHVNAVEPGLVPTKMNEEQHGSELWQKRVDLIPIQRAVTPEEIAETIVFIAENRALVGTTIKVDGGIGVNAPGGQAKPEQKEIEQQPEQQKETESV